MSSCAGYHTPIEDEVAGEGVSDLPSDLGSNSRGGSFLNAQVVVAISFSLSLKILCIPFGKPSEQQHHKLSFYRLRRQVLPL